MNHQLIVQNLTLSLKNKVLLNDMHLAFTAKKLHGILGPNGAGKSTLLKALAGVWKTTGKVYWKGESLLDKERKEISRQISLVPQNPQPTFDFLVEDIVAMGRYPHSKHYSALSEKTLIHEALHAVDAWHLKNRLITEISQGEKQRIYIARALATHSPILMLDEPTANLDIQHHLQIWKLLEKLVDEGKTILITTHDFITAKRHCEEISVLNEGKCLGQGKFCEIMTSEMLKIVFGVVESSTNQLELY